MLSKSLVPAFLLLLATHVTIADEFVVIPSKVKLQGRDSSTRLLVQKALSSAESGPPVDSFEVKIDDPEIAVWENGRVLARGNGDTKAVILAGGTALEVPISVTGTHLPNNWQFSAHVQSVLARQGCNSGACHGALAGKGGFKLSLLGYDTTADYYTITRENLGRRITPSDPGRSLLLAKPSMLIPHKGGMKLPADSSDYALLADWISNGAPGPQPEDAELLDVTVYPRAVTFEPPVESETPIDLQQQLLVLATYADGRVEDVTKWAKFSSTNEIVAGVDEEGMVGIVGSGKGAIVAWFSSRISIATLSVPYGNKPSESAYQDFKIVNFIDAILKEEWQSLGLMPSPRCDDATFIRRAYLDATGQLPTAKQVKEFVGDDDPQRRSKLIDHLLSSEGFVDYWAYKWSDLLLVNGDLLRPDAVAAFYKWIRSQVEMNAPWDKFAEAIVTAKGDSFEQGATNFYAIHQDPESLTENTCQAFMGLSIGCAKCHNHPLEKWTNDQYYAMANMYARVRAKGWGGDTRNGDGKRTLVVLDRGDLIQPSRGVPQSPAALDAEPLDIASTSDRREALAKWLTSPQNPQFSRAIANRIWANYMGRGLVESVDDLRASNPASSEALLDELAAYLVSHNYDTKTLMRLVMNSNAYQRSAAATDGNENDDRLYCRYYPRRLDAEVLHDAIVSVTEVPTRFQEIEFSGGDRRKTDFYPEGTKSIELYDSAVANYFLKTFGRHQRRITCDCERSNQPTVVQVLHLSNGDTMNDKLSADKNVIAGWLAEELPLETVIESAYLRTLSRFPTPDERNRLISLISEADKQSVSRRQSYEDLLWSLMTSQEFLFAH